MFTYKKIKNFLELDFVEFIQDYFIIKTNVNIDCSDGENDLSKHFHYSDMLIETILINAKESISNFVGLDLMPTYTYSGLYTKGDDIFVHKNKKTEHIECLLFLGSSSKKDKIFLSENSDGSDFIVEELMPGDLLVFDGYKYWHWMESLEDVWAIRSFLYFIENKEENQNLIYDGRPYLGFPKNIKNLNGD